tara:strand:- start:40 stop:447 length:408 start_codon:yes stop_codon:yes gene_type:complete
LFLLILFFYVIFIFNKQFSLNNIATKNSLSKLSNVDIYEPKFAINNESEKIYITANEGNFLSKDKILLKENVRFKSNEFSIETENVIFDRNKQTAQSKTKSIFKSKNTKISSDGFDINDKGDKIIFYGKSFIVLK